MPPAYHYLLLLFSLICVLLVYRIQYELVSLDEASSFKPHESLADQQSVVVSALSAQQSNYQEIIDWCDIDMRRKLPVAPNLSPDLSRTLRRIALVVTFNYPIRTSASIIQRLYDGFFAHVIFCGTVDRQTFQSNSSFPKLSRSTHFIHVSLDEMKNGFLAYICPIRAIERALRDIDGYVVAADDVVYNFWNKIDYTRFRGVDNSYFKDRNMSWWLRLGIGKDAIFNAIATLQTELAINPKSTVSKAFRLFNKKTNGRGFEYLRIPMKWMVSDWFYLPRADDWVFAALANVFYRHEAFHELTVPRLATAFGHKTVFVDEKRSGLSYRYLWVEERDHMADSYNTELLFLHPVKWSTLTNHTAKTIVCKNVTVTVTLPSIYRNIPYFSLKIQNFKLDFGPLNAVRVNLATSTLRPMNLVPS